MGWTPMKIGEEYSAISNHQEWQIDNASDINSPPTEALKAAPGSMVWTGDYKHIFNKENDGTWTDILA